MQWYSTQSFPLDALEGFASEALKPSLWGTQAVPHIQLPFTEACSSFHPFGEREAINISRAQQAQFGIDDTIHLINDNTLVMLQTAFVNQESISSWDLSKSWFCYADQ